MAIGDETTGFEYTIGNGGPDPVASLLATNLHTLALESGDSILSNDTDEETEYYFNGVSVNVASSTELNGFSVGARYYVDTETENPDPPGDPILVRTYPDWNLVSATFTVSVEGIPSDRPIFLTTTNAESLYTPSAGVYGTATAGITDGSKFVYTRVFNESTFDYIPRLSPPTQGNVRPENGQFPNDAAINDPANGIYPVDTITAFAPDGRRQILLTYTYSFVYNVGGDDITTGITIEQYVSQPVGDYGPTLKALLENSYYGHGIYGLDQWPDDEPDLYNADGTAIEPAPRPDLLIIDESTPSGFAEYDQATFGAGFPVVLDLSPDVVPVQPEEHYESDGLGFRIPGVDYSTDTYDNDIIPTNFLEYGTTSN